MSQDNWQHKSEMMLCKTCMFFVPKMPPVFLGVDPAKFNPEDLKDLKPGKVILCKDPPVPIKYDCKIGRCRRHAPTLGGWPVLFVTDWCGDHKLDAEKMEAPA